MGSFDKRIIVLFFGRMVQALFAILSIRLLTEYLSPHEVGTQYLINSIFIWFSLVLINPVGMFVNRHIHEWKQNKLLYFYFRQMNKYFLLIALISVPVLYMVKNVFQVASSIPNSELLFLILFYIYITTWFNTLVSFFNLFEMQKIFVSINIISQAVGLALAILTTLAFEAKATFWMSGLLAGQAITLIAAFYIFKKKYPINQYNLQVEHGGLFTKNTFLFCFPVAIATFFMWFMTQGYRMVIESNLGSEVLASIGVGLGLAMSIAGIVEGITTQFYYPKYYAGLVNSDLQQRRENWKILNFNTMVVYIPFCFLTLSVSSLVVRVLVAQNFYHVVPFMVFGALIELLRQLSNTAYLVAHAEKKTEFVILPYLSGALTVAVFLGFLYAYSLLEIKYILWALVFASFVTFMINLRIVKKLIQIDFDYGTALKVVAISMPLLIPMFFVSVHSNLATLFFVAAVSAVWCLGSIYFFNKNIFNDFKT